MFPDHRPPENRRKRSREDDDDQLTRSPMGFTEHRSKRLQSLPLRASPGKQSSEPPSFLSPNPGFAAPSPLRTIDPGTPGVEAVSEDRMWADEPELPPQQQSSAMMSETMENDMDMMDASQSDWARGQPDGQGQPNVGSAPFQAGPAAPSVTGRMPTPIHCSFAAQVRGSTWNGARGTVVQGGGLAMTPEEPNASAFSGMAGVPNQTFAKSVGESMSRGPDGTAAATAHSTADWNMVQDRRLPSPVSESGAEGSLESPDMVLDSPPPPQQRRDPLSQITHDHPLVAGLSQRSGSAGREGGGGGRSARGSGGSSSSQSARDGGSGNSPSAMDVGESPPLAAAAARKKGHTRSKHTLSSWAALEPGVKRSFSIGYRADCEKCRMKVPGHFNHIIIS